jgi:hydrogenase nickel incorporation protein HypB
LKKVDLREKVLSTNEKIAISNRVRFAETGTLVLNLVSSPGSGKTSLIEETVKILKDRYRIYVVTGDIMTENDARRIARHGVEAVQISTGGACHLDAKMVDEKLVKIGSDYDLKVLLVAVGEGDDKPVKYPPMVRASGVLVITKTDLAPYTDSAPEVIEENALKINPEMEVFTVSCKTGQGLDRWIEWLTSRLTGKRAAHPQASDSRSA